MANNEDCSCGKTKQQMTALQFNSESKELNICQIQVPSINDDEVLIEVAFSGVCVTDLHIVAGDFPCFSDGDIILGHEFSGTVKEIGDKVTRVKVGDKVAVDPNQGCMTCEFCRIGRPHFCQEGGMNNYIGIFRNGGWAQYAAVAATQVHKLADTMTLEQGVFCEPLSCLAHGWDVISPVKIGHKILVLGAGIVGSLCASMLHLQGHRKVMIVEPKPERRKVIERLQLGFEILSPEEMENRCNCGDNKLTFDFIIECSGNPQASETAMPMLNYGGTLCVFGVAPPDAKINISPFDIYWKELRILGVIIDPFSFPGAINMAEALGGKYLDFNRLGVKTYDINDYCTALEDLNSGKISKAVFKMC